MEVMQATQVIPITQADASQIGHARRRAVSLAASNGLDEVRQTELSIIVTEAARNIAAHAKEGNILVSPWRVGDRSGVDIYAVDKGKGISDIDRACEDGFSTAGTAGEGLGAIARLAGEFDIYSLPDAGTVLFARVFREAGESAHAGDTAFGALSVPISGETQCGDGWSAFHETDRSVYLMVDGLGHGPFAADAAREAIRAFEDCVDRNPELILRQIHQALAKTRGAAVSVAEILHRGRILNYAGAGNIAAVSHSGGKSRSFVSMNGTVGHTVAKFQQFAYSWEPKSLLLMHSDGLASRWNLDQYPGLASRHPALVAGVLHRDYARGRDDAAIFVIRR